MNDPDHTASPARRFGDVAGAAYLAVGVVGFAMTGITDFASPQGVRLLLLEVNSLHNLLHVLLGGGLLVAASHSADAAGTAAIVTAAALGAAGLIGLAITGWETPLALNTADNIVHLVTAAAAAAAAYTQRRITPDRADVRP